MRSLLPLIFATFILQACADDTTVDADPPNSVNRTDDLTELKSDKLVVAINKFIKSLDLEEVVRGLFSINQGQGLMKLNQFKNAMNISGEDVRMVMGKIAEALETYEIEDLANLTEEDIVSIVEKVITLIRTYQDMIFGKLFAVANGLGIDKNKAFDCVTNLVEVINILSEPNKVKEIVRRHKNEITTLINGFVKIVKLYELEPMFKSIFNAMKEAASRE